MKRMITLFCMMVLLLPVTACVARTTPGTVIDEKKEPLGVVEEESENEVITCPVQYIRTDGWSEEETYPQIAVLTCKAALEAYIEANHFSYNLGCRETVASDSAIGFVTAVEGYDEAWFEDHTLVLVLLEEGSGSNRHEVQGITQQGEILIERIIPEVGTCDMAHWHILLELPKDSPVLEQELTVEFLHEEDWVPPPIVASYASRYASVQVTLPGEGWEWEEIPDTGGNEPFGIRFWPYWKEEISVEICCHPNMLGLCGTDLSTDSLTLNSGKTAYLCYYGDNPWFHMGINDTAGNYYARQSGAPSEYDEEILEILKTVVVGEGYMEKEKAVALAAEVSGITPQYPRAEFDINTGFWTVNIGTLEKSAEVIINDIGGIESITYGEK